VSGRSVVLVHGIADRRTAFDKLEARLRAAGHDVRTIDPRSRLGRERLESLAQRLKEFVDVRFGQHARISLIGFSMGGIVSRYYLQRLGGLQRAERLITISSPHNGTRTARLLPFAGARQLRPGSDFLTDLNADRAVLEPLGLLSFWTPYDLMISPPRSSVLDIGQSCEVPVALHALMTRDARVLDRIVRELSQPEGGSL